MTIKEVTLTEELLEQLLSLSEDWEKEIADKVDMILLSTATKNFRAILHFYIDELGMDFWSARLFKRIK